MIMMYRNYSLTLAKAVLLHNGRIRPDISIPHAVNMKETYEVMKTCLEAISYSKHNRKICADLNIVYH